MVLLKLFSSFRLSSQIILLIGLIQCTALVQSFLSSQHFSVSVAPSKQNYLEHIKFCRLVFDNNESTAIKNVETKPLSSSRPCSTRNLVSSKEGCAIKALSSMLHRRETRSKMNSNLFMSIDSTNKIEHKSMDIFCYPLTTVDTMGDKDCQSLTKFTTVVKFPPYMKIMECRYSEFLKSEKFSITIPKEDGQNDNSFNFCVKLYPRGGGHGPSKYSIFSNKNNKDNNIVAPATEEKLNGFGMAYRLDSLFDDKQRKEKVGLYLQYLPDNDNNNLEVDVSFGLTLIGKQQQGPRFNVEWRSGMRFVPLSKSKLSEGRANDFGANLMETCLLPSFLGIIDDDGEDESTDPVQEPIEVQVDMVLHGIINTTTRNIDQMHSYDQYAAPNVSNDFFGWIDPLLNVLTPRDIRYNDGASSNSRQNSTHDTESVRAGRVIVPIATRLRQRDNMFAAGIYPGVEYRILRVVDPATNDDLFYSQPRSDLVLKPIYPLVSQLERPWPVQINEQDIPRLYTPTMYNVVSAIGSAATAIVGLLTAFVISQAVSFYYIPSRSMEPTLTIGDVLLVEKVSPRLENTVRELSNRIVRGSRSSFRAGDIVLFRPPTELIDVVTKSGGRLNDRDLFVKRVAALPNDQFTVFFDTGKIQINNKIPIEHRDLCTTEPLQLLKKYYFQRNVQTAPSVAATTTVLIPEGTLAVLGDCADVSVDSRVWGPLPMQNIVGRPVLRLWPPSSFGPLPALQLQQQERQ